MDIVGRSVGIYLDSVVARSLFNFEPGPADELPWTILGEVQGEQANIGLWLKLWTVQIPGGLEHEISGERIQLIRWNGVKTILILEAGRKRLGSMGFQLPRQQA